MFEDNPAVRMMQGAPVALDSAGGFTVRDGGWMIQRLVAVWAILTTSRLLRARRTSNAPTSCWPVPSGPPARQPWRW